MKQAEVDTKYMNGHPKCAQVATMASTQWSARLPVATENWAVNLRES